jgi:hypothetical protein
LVLKGIIMIRTVVVKLFAVFAGAAITGNLVILATGVNAQTNVTAPSAARSIVGSWTILQSQAVPGRPPGAPNLITFTSDGNVLASSAFGTFSGGNGSWSRTGDHTVTETHFFIRHDSAGVYIGLAKVRQTITLNATFDQFTGSATTEFLDVQGTVVQTFNPLTQATRIRVESP